MANELRHVSVSSSLSQAEWEDINTHILNNSTQGDMLYVDSTGLIKRLAAATAGSALITGGAGANPSWGPGTWSTWAPTLNQGGAVSATVNYADYHRLGTIAHVQFRLTATATGIGANVITIANMPAAIAPRYTGAYRHCGSGLYMRPVTQYFGLQLEALTTSSLRCVGYNEIDYFGITPAVSILVGDIITGTLVYETT